MNNISYNEWVACFKPSHNINSRNDASYERRLFECHGQDLELILETPPNKVWTLISKEGKDLIVPGKRLKGRLGYFITHNQISPNSDLIVEIESNPLLSTLKELELEGLIEIKDIEALTKHLGACS